MPATSRGRSSSGKVRKAKTGRKPALLAKSIETQPKRAPKRTRTRESAE
jgi:hypothetical protein